MNKKFVYQVGNNKKRMYSCSVLERGCCCEYGGEKNYIK